MANGFFGPMRDDKQNHPDIWTPYIRLALTDEAGATLESDVLALIDTGADVCYIDNELAKKIGLVPVNRLKAFTGTGSKESLLFKCTFLINDQPKDSRLTMATVGADLASNGMNHRVLLGMEALGHFDLRISRSKQLVELAWATT